MANYVWIGGISDSFATSGNWSPAGIPTTGDSVLLDGRAQRSIASSLSQSSVTLAAMRITSAFTYDVGAVSNGALSRLAISVTSLLIGEPNGDGSIGPGSNLIALNFGSNQNTTRVINANTSGTSGFAPIMLLGTHASNALYVSSGWVGVGTDILGESSTYATVNVVGQDANVELGSGLTLTTINQNSGRVTFRSNLTTLNQEGGEAISEGSGTITTADVGGRFVSNSTGTITTLNVQNGGIADFSQSPAARTVTTANVYGTGQINAENGVPLSVTFTNPVNCYRGAKTTQVNFGPDVDVQQSSPP